MVSSGEQESPQICAEEEENRASLGSGYELYIKTVRPKENNRGTAGMSRTSLVTLDTSKRSSSIS